MAALITLQNVGFSLPSKTQSILRDVNLIVGDHFITTIIGPNGAGKTTLLKMLAGLIQPTTGTIRKKKNLKISYVPQQLQANPLIPITASQFLAQTLQKKVSDHDIEQALHFVGLCHVKNTPFMNLSGGERQRILIARALLADADLMILDEPAQGLDISAMGGFYQRLNQIKQQKKCAIVMVSHDLNWVMDTSDHVICLNHHICCSGTPSSVAGEEIYKTLFGEPNLLPKGIAPYIHHHDHEHHEIDCHHA